MSGERMVFVVLLGAEESCEIEYRPQSSFSTESGDVDFFYTLTEAKNFVRDTMKKEMKKMREQLDRIEKRHRADIVREGMRRKSLAAAKKLVLFCLLFLGGCSDRIIDKTVVIEWDGTRWESEWTYDWDANIPIMEKWAFSGSQVTVERYTRDSSAVVTLHDSTVRSWEKTPTGLLFDGTGEVRITPHYQFAIEVHTFAEHNYNSHGLVYSRRSL